MAETNGTWTKPVNWVYSTLKAAAGEGNALEYVDPQNVFLGEHFQFKSLNDRVPAILVRAGVPDNQEEDWDLVANAEHRADFRIELELAIHPEDMEWPYGNTELTPPVRGYTTFAEHVANVLWAATNGQTLGGSVIQWKARLGDHDTQDELYIGVLTLDCWTRYQDGAR